MSLAWRQLCTYLSDDPGLWKALSDQVDSQEASQTSTLWQSVLDGLDASGDLAFLDRADSGVELATALEALPRLQGTRLDLDLIGDVDGSLDEAIVRADEVLAGDGLCLVHLPDEEDPEAYPLVAVRLAVFDDVQILLASLGQR